MIAIGCGETPTPPDPDKPDPEKPIEEVNPNLHLMTFELNEDGNTYTFKALQRGAEGEIKIPGKYEGKTVTKIANDACVGNETITSLIISDGITEIGDNAFKNCKGLTSVTFPNTLTVIGAYAFNKCSAITSAIVFPKSLKKICDHAFDNASNITSWTFNEGLEEIGERVFDYNKSTSLYLPDSLTKIGWRAFIYMKQLQTVSIGNKVTHIGDMAFAYAEALEQVEFRGTKAQWDAIYIDQTHTQYGWDYLACKPKDPPTYTFKYSDSTYLVYPRLKTDTERVEEKVS